VIEPGHDAWVVGEEPVVAFEFEQASGDLREGLTLPVWCERHQPVPPPADPERPGRTRGRCRCREDQGAVKARRGGRRLTERDTRWA
jgi:hypothetical protein